MITAFQSNAFQNNAFQIVVVAPVTGGGGIAHSGWEHFPRYRQKTKEELRAERIKLGIIPPDVEKAVTAAVENVLEAAPVANPQIDLAIAEQEARQAVMQLKKQWMKEYIQLLSLEYTRIQQEREGAQIVMMLFQM